MLEGDTSTTTRAHELGTLCQGKNLVVNLIPYNATNVKDPLKCPSWDDMMKFRDIVSSYGVFCTIRRTMGSDIDSACGQLITLQQQKNKEGGDIEDASSSCGPRSASSRPSTRKSRTVSSKDNNKKTRGDDDNNPNDKYIIPLVVVAGIVATCFFASVVMRRRKR